MAECAVSDKVWGIGLSMYDNDRFDVSKWKIDSAVNFFDTGLDCNEGFDFNKEQLNQKKTIALNETDELEKLRGYVLIG